WAVIHTVVSTTYRDGQPGVSVNLAREMLAVIYSCQRSKGYVKKVEINDTTLLKRSKLTTPQS
ncbi:hypothetical protein, partial [Ekhidna sp.]